MSATDLAYGATAYGDSLGDFRPRGPGTTPLCSYTFAMACPVLAQATHTSSYAFATACPVPCVGRLHDVRWRPRVLAWAYAVCAGTELGYGATELRGLKGLKRLVLSAILLRHAYAVSGTDIRRADIMLGTDYAVCCAELGCEHAISTEVGTELGYGGAMLSVVSCYHAIRTELGYGGTMRSVLSEGRM
eukprot:3939842-Rhodomonas_salina.1